MTSQAPAYPPGSRIDNVLAQGKREKPARHKGKGKTQPGKREKGKSTTDDLPEISLDQAPRARTYARTARHETISRLDYPPNLRYNKVYYACII